MVDIDIPNCEFGLEIVVVLGYCYWLHARGMLKSTTSLKGMSDFYFFSPRHTESRCGQRACVTLSEEFPASSFHDCRAVELPSCGRWIAPPLQERWLADGMSAVLKLWFDYDLGRGIREPVLRADKFDLPMILIHNKVCDEWGRGNIHHIPNCILRELVSVLSSNYLVVYCRPTGREQGYSVDQNAIDQQDSDLMTAEGAGAVLLQTIMSIWQTDVNLTQMLLHSVSTRFVSVQGGNSVLASFFGGTNVIYAREGVEVRNSLYQKLFKSLSMCRIHTTPDLQCLKDLVCKVFL